MPSELIQQFLQRESLPDSYGIDAIDWFLPLATELDGILKSIDSAYLLGINGAQGTGKSTLANLLVSLLSDKGHKVVQLSIDDFYLSRADRHDLANNIHPLLATRGVPGTHDIALALRLIHQLLSTDLEQSIAVPRFNKAVDDPFPESAWQWAEKTCDLVILEGWFVGSKPQEEAELAIPVNELESNEDADGTWRGYVNQQLGGQYQELFDRLDSLIFLKAPGFDQVFQWRSLQESKLAEQQPTAANTLMNPQQLQQFIQHFERLSRHCMDTLSGTADIVFELDENHRIKARKDNG
ncbi:MAG: hypothetical protein QGG67_08685 [Gammaproteobacteria bacterium]|jgi:D-glycerate 3-kinase|nr:hypothetical protein [Gammaproteobacteria bacterium]MDP6096045.1 hypothetical protein [Gammaproteobacteria bacterium]HJO11085.1 hypothetical protein [Gammaproteobacteria bacterium]|tara:strand:+ start:1632 stop:2519 length:888 start_codon:yes stop_codon:yes gene_type:complete